MSDRLKEIRERIDRCYFTATSTAYSDIRYLLAQLAERDATIAERTRQRNEWTARAGKDIQERMDHEVVLLNRLAERDALLERLCRLVDRGDWVSVTAEHIALDYRKLKEGR